jgi:cytochrome b pre-mRNA-processing protein 3
MNLQQLFRPRPAVAAGRSLYAGAVAQARRPGFYLDLAVPDTTEGRFELYSLHVVLLLDRLSHQGPQAAETHQAVFDAYLRGLDDALREMGVGDLSVGRKMRKLGQAFYGRLKAYETALGDRDALIGVLTRTVYDDAAPAEGLADYTLQARQALVEQPLDAILAGEARWPGI